MNDTTCTAFEALQNHPFTFISLADREKFHTGMLAFTINELAEKEKLEFLNSLWGVENCERLKANSEKKLIAAVEQNSVDLVVKRVGKENTKTGDRKVDEVLFWAEMKFKTTLSERQISDYKAKHPNAIGALFALFTGVESLPTNFREVCFHEKVTSAKSTILGGVVNSDSKTLVRLWIEYLENIKTLTDFIKSNTTPIHEPDFRQDLHRIKLKGIFEHYRLSLFSKIVRAKLKDNGTAWVEADINQFNSHGNSGIEHVMFPFFEKDSANGKDYRYGLQWQSNALKLFVCVETGQLGDVDNSRLEHLLHNLKKINLAAADRALTISCGKKFRSYTIATWDIFNSDLDDVAEKYVKRLVYLAGGDCKAVMIGEGVGLS